MKPATITPELAAKRKRRAEQSRQRMVARGINLNKWHQSINKQRNKDQGA